jgi:transcriptional regulator with XRE-family HTH domain
MMLKYTAEVRMGLGDKELGARLAAARKKDKPESEVSDKPFDFSESYLLRAKMLGVLIRDARLNAARTVEDCARLLRVETHLIEMWEYGEAVPSLPQLELLAYYFDIPVSHFWGQQTLENDRANKTDAQLEYIQLRQRMIGALLRQAREERQIPADQVAATANISVETLQQYEVGEAPIPMHELSVLAGAVHRNMSYFLESSSYIGMLLQIREEWKQFLALEDEVRQFAANPLHLGFLKIAMTFGKMPAEELRKIAEGMLEISM